MTHSPFPTRLHILLALILVIVSMSVPSRARADVAPPAQPPGSNLEPGAEVTQVRMAAETVTLDVRATGDPAGLGIAYVTADFTMHNTGNTGETMQARFPIGANNGFSGISEISDMKISVAGSPVAVTRITGEDPYGSSDPSPWAAFDVSFPPGQDVPIQVRYTLNASGEYPFIWFRYILSTGAAWKDTIGSADIIVKLPYDLDARNVLFDNPGLSIFGTSPGGVLDGHTIRWHYDNLEPTDRDNFEIDLIMPSAWQHLLEEQQNVAQDPSDGEAWGRIGKLCKEMAFSSRGKGFRAGVVLDTGGQQLYDQGLAAYEKALTLLPNDAEWHAGYAQMLGYHAYFMAYQGGDVRPEEIHSLQEIQRALALAPGDPKVQTIAEEIHYFFPDGMRKQGDTYDFPWLIATPELKPTDIIPTVLAAEVTPAPPVTVEAPTPAPTTAPITPTPAPAGRPSLPICGSAVVLPAALLLAVLPFHKKRR